MTPLSASYTKNHWKNIVLITHTAAKMRPKNT